MQKNLYLIDTNTDDKSHTMICSIIILKILKYPLERQQNEKRSFIRSPIQIR